MNGKDRVSKHRRGQVQIRLKRDGSSETKCIDLVGDAWQDYLDDISAAKNAAAKEDLHTQNRFIRGAIKNLISHMEGVICCAESALIKSQAGYEPFRRDDGKEPCLFDKVGALRRFVQRSKRIELPYLPFRLKALRDIAVHLTISKNDRNTMLSAMDLYELKPDVLQQEGVAIDAWLNQLCHAVGYRRFIDTEHQATLYSNVLGGKDNGIKRI